MLWRVPFLCGKSVITMLYTVTLGMASELANIVSLVQHQPSHIAKYKIGRRVQRHTRCWIRKHVSDYQGWHKTFYRKPVGSKVSNLEASRRVYEPCCGFKQKKPNNCEGAATLHSRGITQYGNSVTSLISFFFSSFLCCCHSQRFGISAVDLWNP